MAVSIRPLNTIFSEEENHMTRVAGERNKISISKNLVILKLLRNI